MQYYANIRRDYLEKVFIPTFKHVLSAKPPIDETYKIADKTIRICAYTPQFEEFATGAFSHLATQGSEEADLTIHLLDSASTGIQLNGPWTHPDYGDQEAPDSAKEADQTFQGVYVRGENMLHLYDISSKTAYFWIHDSNDVPKWMYAAPLRTILHWFFSHYGIHFVHGAAVGTENGAVLLTAMGGSGKSTTALSCLASGMDYIGDDYVLIEKNTIHGLYNSVKIVPEQLSNFPNFRPDVWNSKSLESGESDKAILFLSKLFPTLLKENASLVAILIPRIATKTEIIPATKLEAMLALLPTTLFQLPLAPTTKVSSLTSIIGKTPCYILELGPEVRTIPETIRAFLDKHSHE